MFQNAYILEYPANHKQHQIVTTRLGQFTTTGFLEDSDSLGWLWREIHWDTIVIWQYMNPVIMNIIA